jgi:hypothetical protein
MAVALIGGAQEEGREELMELWARLLANAMDPQFEHRPTFIYRGRKEMDPPDAVVLRHIHERNITSVRRGHTPEESPSTRVENIAVAIGRRSDEVEVSLRHLQDLLFFDYVNNSWYVNATSREFLRACYPEVKTA